MPVRSALAAMMIIAASLVSQGSVSPVLAAERPTAMTEKPLTEFQWALNAAGSLLLVPVDGLLYPARLDGAGVLESLPPKLAVILYGGEASRKPFLHEAVSPLAVTPQGWIMERRVGESWVPMPSFVLHGTRFFGLVAVDRFEAMDPAEIRFSSRQDGNR